MKRLLSILLACLLHSSLALAVTFNLSVTITPEGSGSINSNGGTYEEGSRIYLSTSQHTGFIFLGWYEEDELVSNSTSFYYTMPSRNASLTAKYEYNPEVPANPEEPATYYRLTINENPSGACSLNSSGGSYTEGSRVYLNTSAHTGFVFLGWYEGEDLISKSSSFDYIMLARDVTLTAKFEYNPGVPAHPEEPATYYRLTINENTPGACSLNSSGGSYTEGSRIYLSASPHTGFVFSGWHEGEDLISKSSSFDYIMPARDVTLTAKFEYNPSTPGNPNKNHWNKETGEVIIDDFIPGNLYNAIVTTINESNRNEVLRIVVIGKMNDYDFGAINNFKNCTTFDLSRVSSLLKVPSYAFDETNIESVILPAYVQSIGNNAFYNCSRLSAITIYTATPPTVGNNAFHGIKDSMTVYVPEEAVDAYKASEIWGKYKIQAIPDNVYSIPVGATPDDPEAWNDLNRAHQLTLEGTYDNPSKLNGKIEYAIDDYNEWTALTKELESGETFKGTVIAKFNAELPEHSIRLRAVDVEGGITKLTPITYIDVSPHSLNGIENKYFNWGDSIYQTNLTCDLSPNEYEIKGYKNNVNAGVASFNIEGVFPRTIGRKTYEFNIMPLQLEGDIEFVSEEPIRYTGSPLTPEWKFTEEKYNTLNRDADFNITWSDNVLPGMGLLKVTGIHNFNGTISKSFYIDKNLLSDKVYRLYLPTENAFYDGNPHAASYAKSEGVGEISFYYAVAGSEDLTESAPIEAGDYDAYVEISEGELYYGLPLTKFGSFTIYNFDNKDWENINALNNQLIEAGVSDLWNLEEGVSSVGSLKGLEIEGGHVVGVQLSDIGLTGSFPTTIFSFTNLKRINISNNNLSGNLSTLIAEIALQQPESFGSIESLDVSGNKLNGNLGIITQSLTSLNYLDASNNAFEDVYPAIPESVNFINISNQEIGRTIDLNLSNITADNIITQLPTILLYDLDTHGFLTELDLLLTNKPISLSQNAPGDVWSMQIHISPDGVSMPNMIGGNTFRGQNGEELHVYEIKKEKPTGTTFNAKLNFEKGDANFIGGIDASDLQATILYAFGLYSEYPFNFTAANTYEDEIINVQDVTCTVNILLEHMTNMPTEVPARIRTNTEDAPSEAEIRLLDGKVILYAERPIAALSVKATSNIQWTTEKYGLLQSKTDGNLVAYSLSGAEIPAGEHVIGEFYDAARIVYTSIADTNAQAMRTIINNHGQSAVNIIPFEIDNKCQIFDITGKRHTEPVKGLNIIIREGKVLKYYNNK